MDGIRDTTTGEVDLTLSAEEASAIKVAVVYTLFEIMTSGKGREDVRAALAKINHALEALGVTIDG